MLLKIFVLNRRVWKDPFSATVSAIGYFDDIALGWRYWKSIFTLGLEFRIGFVEVPGMFPRSLIVGLIPTDTLKC